MLKNMSLFASFSLAVLAFSPAALGETLTIEDKVALQAGMFHHIKQTTIDGVIPHVELKDGSVVDLVPTKAHPMILAFGKNFVLCTDFRDPKGKFVNVDFYMTKHGSEFVVFQTEINNREPLKELMKSGKVSTIR